jgi:predicted pyridoxine 5'-phosphate oxidase superfamily flavin-nucleotide-binding protein
MAHLPDNVAKLLKDGHLVWVATIGVDGWPNVAVKGASSVADSEHLIFTDVFSKKTRANLEHNPMVAVGIHDSDNEIAVQVKGRATLWDKGPLYESTAARFAAKHPSASPPKYIVEIAVESVWDMTAGPNAGEKIA